MQTSTDMQPNSAVEAGPRDVGHEPLTLSIRGIMIFFALFIGIGVVLHVLVWWLYSDSTHHEQTLDRPGSALISQRPAPAGPPLQPSPLHGTLPQQDLSATRAAENAEFARRGWLEDTDGTVKVPDDIAQKVIVMTARKATTQP